MKNKYQNLSKDILLLAEFLHHKKTLNENEIENLSLIVADFAITATVLLRKLNLSSGNCGVVKFEKPLKNPSLRLRALKDLTFPTEKNITDLANEFLNCERS